MGFERGRGCAARGESGPVAVGQSRLPWGRLALLVAFSQRRGLGRVPAGYRLQRRLSTHARRLTPPQHGDRVGPPATAGLAFERARPGCAGQLCRSRHRLTTAPLASQRICTSQRHSVARRAVVSASVLELEVSLSDKGSGTVKASLALRARPLGGRRDHRGGLASANRPRRRPLPCCWSLVLSSPCWRWAPRGVKRVGAPTTRYGGICPRQPVMTRNPFVCPSLLAGEPRGARTPGPWGRPGRRRVSDLPRSDGTNRVWLGIVSAGGLPRTRRTSELGAKKGTFSFTCLGPEYP